LSYHTNRIGSEETSQPIRLSRSPKDPRVISITSNLPPLQKVGSLPLFRISGFEEFRNSTRASLYCYSLCCPILYDVQWSRTTQIGESFQFQNIARVSQFPLTGEDHRNRRADMRNTQPTVVLPHFHYTLLGLLPSPYKRILEASRQSRSS
jgi:hypothetical protein